MREEGGRATISTFWLQAKSTRKEITWCTDRIKFGHHFHLWI